MARGAILPSTSRKAQPDAAHGSLGPRQPKHRVAVQRGVPGKKQQKLPHRSAGAFVIK